MRHVCSSLMIALVLLVAAPAIAQDIATECGFDNQGQACATSDGAYGICSEAGPNSCDGENPDFPGECRGFPTCQDPSGSCNDKAAGDACTITQEAPAEETTLNGTCAAFSDDPEFLTCDLSAAPSSGGGDDDEDGCAVAPGQPSPIAPVVLLGLVLAVVVRKRRA